MNGGALLGGTSVFYNMIKGLPTLRLLARGLLAWAKSHSVPRSPATSHATRHVVCLELPPVGVETLEE